MENDDERAIISIVLSILHTEPMMAKPLREQVVANGFDESIVNAVISNLRNQGYISVDHDQILRPALAINPLIGLQKDKQIKPGWLKRGLESVREEMNKEKTILPDRFQKIPKVKNVVNFDLRIQDLKDLSNNKRFKNIVSIIEEASGDLIASDARVGHMEAHVNDDGLLEFRFVSRYPVVK